MLPGKNGLASNSHAGLVWFDAHLIFLFFYLWFFIFNFTYDINLYLFNIYYNANKYTRSDFLELFRVRPTILERSVSLMVCALFKATLFIYYYWEFYSLPPVYVNIFEQSSLLFAFRYNFMYSTISANHFNSWLNLFSLRGKV